MEDIPRNPRGSTAPTNGETDHAENRGEADRPKVRMTQQVREDRARSLRGDVKPAREVPAEVQTVDEGLPNDKVPDSETPVRENASE
ncbi:hypothetical protein [Agromyces sp. NPDC058110]|uniref:hypothetical protein n=1 Tax=Agromyces sp. NPDC058110 TaxID=3346345 RepID=UPI0036D9D230